LIDLSISGCAVVFQYTEEINTFFEKKVNTNFNMNIFAPGTDQCFVKVKLLRKTNINLSHQEYIKLGVIFICDETYVSDDIKNNEFKVNKDIEIPNGLTLPTFCEHPFFFREYLFFELKKISTHSLHFLTSARNQSLFPGLKIKVKIWLPIVGVLYFEGSIKKIDLQENNRILFSLEIKDTKDMGLLCNWILFSRSDISAHELKLSGFYIKDLKPALLNIDYMTTEEEWIEILKLRLLAQNNSGKFLDIQDYRLMEDFLDKYSRQLVVKQGRRIVAAARVVFNNGNPDFIEHSKSYGATLPSWVLKTKFVEVSRVVTHPEFQNIGLLFIISEFIVKVCIDSEHDYILSSCDNSLLKIYTKFGFKKISEFGDKENGYWNLIIASASGFVKGQNLNPVRWSFLFKNIALYQYKRQWLTFTLKEKVRFSLYKIIDPLSQWIIKYKKRKKRKKRK